MKKLLLLALFACLPYNSLFAQNNYGNEESDDEYDTEEVYTDDEEEEEDPDAFFIDHKILPGERMIMISKKYMVDPKDIYEYNEWAVGGYDSKQGGGVLKIPLHKSHKKDLDAFKAKLEKEKGGPIQVPAPPKKKKKDIKPEDFNKG